MSFDETSFHREHSDRLLQFVLDAVNTGILILDQDLTIIFANSRAKTALLPRQSLIGTKFQELFPEEDRKILVPNIVKLAKGQGEFEGDVMLLRGDNTGFIAHLSVALWEDDRHQTFVVTLSDVSKLKAVERQLHRHDRVIYLGQMLDDISHQIRNPVLAIGGFARRLLITKVERPEYVKVILEEAGRLELLLDVLTRFIQLPKPKFTLCKSKTIYDLATEMANNLAKDYNFDISISNEYEPDSVVVTDLALLKAALEPVIINGLEAYSDSQKKCAISLEFVQPSKPWGIGILIRDNGEGIRPPLMDRIFHPFFTTKTGHLGMGLTFTKRITDELDGRIHVESALGKGTSVQINLPGDRRSPLRTTPIKE